MARSNSGLLFGVALALTTSAASAQVSSAENVRRELCVNPPATGTRGQLVRTVVAYIDARPARMHENFGVLSLEALRTAWPCSKK